MKSGFRLAGCTLLALLVPLYLIKAHLQDLCDQYRAGKYLVDWLHTESPAHEGAPPKHGAWGDKVIVMAKLEEEPTYWVEAELPEYVVGLMHPPSSYVKKLTGTRRKLETRNIHCQPVARNGR